MEDHAAKLSVMRERRVRLLKMNEHYFLDRWDREGLRWEEACLLDLRVFVEGYRLMRYLAGVERGGYVEDGGGGDGDKERGGGVVHGREFVCVGNNLNNWYCCCVIFCHFHLKHAS